MGVGALISQFSSQLLYTSAPLSLVLVMNLLNRRRLDELLERNAAIAIQKLDQRLSKHIELLNQQMSTLPTPETLGSLKKSLLIKNREVLEKLSQEIAVIQEEMKQRFIPFEKQNLGTVRQDITHLQGQYQQLCDSVVDVATQIQQLSTSSKMDGLESAIAQLQEDTMQLRVNLQNLSDQTKPTVAALQDQIAHLNRQLQKLPPPFDSTALKQEVEELIRVVADLVPKRDWSNLVAEMKALQQQQESQGRNEENLRRKLQELNQHIQSRPAKSTLTSIQNEIAHLNRQFQELPPPFDSTLLKQEIAGLMRAVADRVPKQDFSGLVTQIKALQEKQKFQSQVEEALYREMREINQQLQALMTTSQRDPATLAQPSAPSATLGYQSSALDETADEITESMQPQREFQSRIEDTLQRELKALDRQLQLLPSEPEFRVQIQERLQQELQEINEQLRKFPVDPHYELVFDFKSKLSQNESFLARKEAHDGSRATLTEALRSTQHRLILIWPWSSQCALDDRLMEEFEEFLNLGRQLDLGWCHQADRDERFLASINQRWAIQPRQQSLQKTLQKLLQLKRSFPDLFQFKILGTRENFLVSDESFAVLGTDEALIANTVFPELELKLRTTDPEVIRQLLQRFDNPVLQPDDLAAYWNRAVTRYDLGDKEGAIADLSHILSIKSDDVLAYNYRGIAHFELGDSQGAIADFNRALEINPQQIATYCNRGFVLSEMGDQLGAIADYSLAIQNQPDSAIAYFYRGLACQKYGDPQAALTDYDKAIQLAPNSAPCHYYRGLIQQKMGNQSEAIADLQLAAELFNQRGNKANATKALKSLAKLRYGAVVAPRQGDAGTSDPTQTLIGFGSSQVSTAMPDQTINVNSSGTEMLSNFFNGSDFDTQSTETGWLQSETLTSLFYEAESETNANGGSSYFNSSSVDTPDPNPQSRTKGELESSNTQLGIETLSSFFYGSEAETERPNSETLADFCNRF